MQTCINREKFTFCVIKSLDQLKNLKTGRILNLGLELTGYHACPQKPNTSRETVPLKNREEGNKQGVEHDKKDKRTVSENREL
jgi:hypothetical protein